MARRAFAPLLLLASCMAPSEADDLSLLDDEPWAAPHYAAIPDGASEEDLEDDRPRIEVSTYGGAEEFRGTATCPFTVEATGFPAVSVDGGTVVSFMAETLSSSDGEDEIVTVAWVDVETDARESSVLVDGDPEASMDRSCRALWRKAKRHSFEVNERLATQRWRTLASVELSTVTPFDDWEDEEAPHSDVEIVRRSGQVVFRIPGVKVLGRAEMDWRVPSDDGCEFEGYASEVFGDRQTGVVAIEVSQYAVPCYCYAETLFHAMRVSEAFFDATASAVSPAGGSGSPPPV